MNILQNTSTKYKTWMIWEYMFYAGLIAFSVGFAYTLLSWFLVKEGPCIPMVVTFLVVALFGAALFAVAGVQLLKHRKVYAKAKTPKKVKSKAKEQKLQKVEAVRVEAGEEVAKQIKPSVRFKIPAFLTGLLTGLTNLAGKIKFKKKIGEKKETAQTYESVKVKAATEEKKGQQEEEARQAISDEEIVEAIEAADEKDKKNQKKQTERSKNNSSESAELKLADEDNN